ncbi:hypothetical protein PVAND_006771 [Polypedilum vanderplanki]|uniref:Secreted protein n=1 Tax=Polypedilum vanderplanki TaxID=319348 RepID=A0A9J6C482_POLVA|nr:hypothetical protein PVAND_006771 [Polypedilum vanderplanki]
MRKILILIVVIFTQSTAMPFSNDSSDEAKGIFDGILPNSSSSTTASPLPSLPDAFNKVSENGPMLILGSFQAIVTKFDPALIQSIPGIGLPQLPAGK